MTSPQEPGFRDFATFWPYYLAQHRSAHCRAWHYVSAAVTVALLAVAFAVSAWALAAIPPAAYALAWIGHAFERNRPATWEYPWWSLRAEFRMVRLALSGGLRREFVRCGLGG